MGGGEVDSPIDWGKGVMHEGPTGSGREVAKPK